LVDEDELSEGLWEYPGLGLHLKKVLAAEINQVFQN
jgi:hypothetical protein